MFSPRILAPLAIAILIMLAIVPLNYLSREQRQLATNVSSTINKTYYTLKRVQKVTSLMLAREIAPAEEYVDLVPYMMNLQDGDVVNVYLMGEGGNVDGAELLSYLFHTTKAKVNIIVYGDVYSADAVLALQGHTLTVLNPNIKFLFHIPALENGDAVNTDICKDMEGSDRGHPLKEKCVVYVNAFLDEYQHTLETKIHVVLTPEQFLAYQQGNDVYVNASQVTAAL